MNSTKLYNIEKIAQGRLSGFSPNYVQDTRVSARWLIELVQEVRRLNNQRAIQRARITSLHKLVAKVDRESEREGYYGGQYSLAQEVKKILGPDNEEKEDE